MFFKQTFQDNTEKLSNSMYEPYRKLVNKIEVQKTSDEFNVIGLLFFKTTTVIDIQNNQVFLGLLPKKEIFTQKLVGANY